MKIAEIYRIILGVKNSEENKRVPLPPGFTNSEWKTWGQTTTRQPVTEERMAELRLMKANVKVSRSWVCLRMSIVSETKRRILAPAVLEISSSHGRIATQRAQAMEGVYSFKL